MVFCAGALLFYGYIKAGKIEGSKFPAFICAHPIVVFSLIFFFFCGAAHAPLRSAIQIFHTRKTGCCVHSRCCRRHFRCWVQLPASPTKLLLHPAGESNWKSLPLRCMGCFFSSSFSRMGRFSQSGWLLLLRIGIVLRVKKWVYKKQMMVTPCHLPAWSGNERNRPGQ